MFNFNHQNSLDSKDSAHFPPLDSAKNSKNQEGDQEEEKSKDKPLSPKKGNYPPKEDSNTFLTDSQIKKEEPLEQNGEIHSEKFNGPLEKPKTANKAFGSISDFLLFFENRNLEIKKFAKKFQEMEDMEKKDPSLSIEILNQDVAPILCQSFKKIPAEFKNYESSNSISVPQNTENEGNEPTQKQKSAFSKFLQKKKAKNVYADLFEKKFISLEDFYKRILHAYTIPGVLYLRMNEYLRMEDWVKLDGLLIYTYCIFKAYLWGPTGLTDANGFEILKSRSDHGKLILYRRAGFDQVSLDYYSTDKTKEFSWSGVTSTSLLESATRSFGKPKPGKKAVLVMIEVDFNDLSPENFNALYLAKLSKCPSEEEVALAPGSIFELLDITKDKPEVEMRLKLITNAKILAHQGKFLHGMLQRVMRNEDELKLVCLKEKEFSRAIKHCKGNQLIAKLDFSLCHFNQWSVKVLRDVQPTINNLSSMTFNSVIFESGCLDQIMECLGDGKIKQLEIINSLGDENDIKSFLKCLKYLDSLTILRLSFEENFKIDGILIRELYNEALQYLNSECVFELNMINDCDIIVKDLKRNNYKQNFGKKLHKKWPTKSESFEEKIKGSYFPKPQGEEEPIEMIEKENEEKRDTKDENSTKHIAKSLHQENTLNLIGKKELFSLGDNFCFPKRTLFAALNDKYTLTQPLVESKDPTLSGKQPLETLNLNFEGCENLHDQNLKSLGCEGIQVLQSLKTLNLDFSGCDAITDQALDLLSNGVIQKLTGLNNLHLNFGECVNITDEGLKRLAFDGIQYLQSLTGLSLNFCGCLSLTNEGLRSLTLQGIAKIKSSLTSLHLNFEKCFRITDRGLKNLFYDSFEFLTSLDLNLKCTCITNEGIEELAHRDLQKFKRSLKVLSLSFDKSCELTVEGLKILSCDGISHLESLTSLSLSFSSGWNSEIDNGIINLYDQAIQHLESLTSLCLTFDEDQQVTNEGLQSLHFPSGLIVLRLSFDNCKEITDDGLDSFSRKLGHLKTLDHLHLGFGNCGKITDNGIRLLCSQGIKPLSKLNILCLQIGKVIKWAQPHCHAITDQSLKSIGSEGIKHLPELKTLHLDLEGCSQITAKGLEDLCSDGIQYLKKLTDLHLGFFRCYAITDEGLDILSRQGIFYLRHSLKTLYLDFHECTELSNVGLESLLTEGILYLEQITTLHLQFSSLGKISGSQLLRLQYQIHLLKLPQLQLPLEIFWERAVWGVCSPCDQSSDSPNSAYVLYKERLEFPPKLSKDLFDEVECQKGENLTLEFEQGTNITDLDISNFLFHGNKMKTFKDLKTLNLTFDGCTMITDFTLYSLCFQCLQHLESLTSLHLSFDGCFRITDAGLESLGSIGIQSLKSLTSLSLSFNSCPLVKNQGLMSFISMKHLKVLTSLSLNFDYCEITNKGLRRFCDHGLSHLESIKSMHLSFQFCKRITNKGLKGLNLKSMKSLTSFFIDFFGTKITERIKKQLSQSSSNSLIIMNENNLNKLMSVSHFMRQNLGIDQGLSKTQPILKDSVEIVQNKMFTRYLGRNHYVFSSSNPFDGNIYESGIIENVDDIFKSAKKDIIALILLSGITELEDKVKRFISEQDGQDGQEIQYLQSLTSLTLFLGEWNRYVTDSALSTLCLTILQHLKSLINLSLTFDGCYLISNMGFRYLWCQGVKHLTSLVTLHLSFGQRVQITDVELGTLSSEVIQHLKSLTALHLSFEECEEISDEGLQKLWNDGILHLKSLKTLDLIFEKCCGVSCVGFNNLNNLGDSCFPSLEIFRLSLGNCVNFNDEGIESLCNGVIHLLRGLTTFFMSFERNEQITDSGLKYLSCQGIIHLKLLTSLHLNFYQCKRITDKGVQSLNLYSFKFLTSLYLNFDQCFNLTDHSFKDLTSHLRSLKILHLSLRGCSSAVTDQVLKDLGIQYLTSLYALYLCFDECKEITDVGVEALCSEGIQSLKSLKILHLSFALCDNITEKVLESLSKNGIKHLGLLENLHLSFFGCKKISHAQLLLFQAQINLPQLQHPLEIIGKVIFSESYLRNKRFLGATNPNQENSETRPVWLRKTPFSSMSNIHTNVRAAMLQKLQNLSIVDRRILEFKNSFYSTDINISQRYYCSDEMEDFNNLEVLKIAINHSQGLEEFNRKIRSLCLDILCQMKSLKILHVSFETSIQITDAELRILGFEGILSLVELTQLHLSFDGCQKITDEGLMSLSSGCIQNLKQLNVLDLNFNGCYEIADQGVTSLCSDGIQSLKGLKTLHLSFDGCIKITDEVLKSVSLLGILRLSSIQDLRLSFLDCPKISSSSYQAFLKILEYLGYKRVDQNSKDLEDSDDLEDSEDLEDKETNC